MTALRLPMLPRFATTLGWALADLRRDAVISAMSVFLLFLLIGPPLFLEVLRAGVVEGWATTLQTDPRNREVVVIGERGVTDADLSALRVLPETGFVVPEPSTFISSVRLQGGGRPVALNMRTSAGGDPVLGPAAAPSNPDQVTLTATAAQQLQVGVGDTINMTLRRQPRDRPQEILSIPLRVVGMIPPTVWDEEAVFIHPLRAAGATLWLQPGSARHDALATPKEEVWRSIRIYARQVRHAPQLATRLNAMGFETRVASEQVALLVNLSDGLRGLMVISVVGGLCGLCVAVWLLQVLSVARRRREIALMAAAGLDRAGLIAFFVLQGVMLSAAALFLAAVCLVPMRGFAAAFADRFVQSVGGAGEVDLATLAAGAAAILALSFFAAAIAAWRIRHFDLSADLRAD